MLDTMVVISLDRTPERYAGFRRLNPGVTAERFAGVDGRTLDRDRLIVERLIRSSNIYGPGSLGAALSHITLWRRCASGDRPLHILEDDVVLRPDFSAVTASVLAGAPEWDIVLWGWNFDWPLKLNLGPGLGSAVLQANQPELRAEWTLFGRGPAPAPALAGLVSAAGLPAYSVSPRGARRLIDKCLPLGDEPAVYAHQPTRGWGNSALSVEMSRHYGGVAAFVSFPPMVVTLNEHGASLALNL